MVISYKKLWKLLIDKDLKKKDLPAIAGISRSSITKIGAQRKYQYRDLSKDLQRTGMRFV